MSLPSTVDAITIKTTGGFDVIEKTTIPFPKVGAGDIVIKVEYAGVNFNDTYYRSGLYSYKAFPAILGRETSGRIVALPSDLETVNNETYKKYNYAIGIPVASDYLGTHATYISVPWKHVYPIPEPLSTRIGAGLIQGITVASFFEEAYEVKRGDIILVHTVAGGMGLLFTQLAKSIGATVIGTTSTPAKAELAKSHGADHVILYTQENTVDKVLELTDGVGVDAIFDGVGRDTFDSNFKMIKRKGTFVSFGNLSGAVEPVLISKFMEKNIKFLRPNVVNYLATQEEADYYRQRVFDLIARGIFKIEVFKEYEFSAEGVRQAQKDLTQGRTTGKLLIQVSDVM